MATNEQNNIFTGKKDSDNIDILSNFFDNEDIILPPIQSTKNTFLKDKLFQILQNANSKKDSFSDYIPEEKYDEELAKATKKFSVL